MGELTSEAASKPPLRLSVGLMRGHPSPSSSPLPGFSVFSMPFYRHQSVWRGDTTRPVSPGVGPWICEIGKLSVSLPSSILHFPRFLLSYFFHHASKLYTSSPPPQRDKGTIGFFGIFGRTRDDVLFLPVSIFNFLDVQREGKIALFVSEQFGQSIYRVWKYFGYRVWGRCSNNFYHEK